MRGVLDTSIFIAAEQGRRLATDSLPEEAAVSVVTIAELELGVHLAMGPKGRRGRLATLSAVQSTYAALPIDDEVASAFAQIAAEAKRPGRRPRVQDSWIGATAAARQVPVFTQDADFDGIPGVQVVRV
ncbi:MAG: PIN domain-containing protein [Candidatus Dormibacteria bacterium]